MLEGDGASSRFLLSGGFVYTFPIANKELPTGIEKGMFVSIDCSPPQ